VNLIFFSSLLAKVSKRDIVFTPVFALHYRLAWVDCIGFV